MNHKSSSTHIHILMNGHNPEHNHKCHGGGITNVHQGMKPENHLMRSGHFNGGITKAGPVYSKGGKVHHHKKFAKGGHCYAEGGEADKEYGEKPLTGQLRRGGRTKRSHHYWGQDVIDSLPQMRAKHYAGGPSTIPTYSEGGKTKHRQHHSEGQYVFGRLPLIGSIAKGISKRVGTFDENKYGGHQYGRQPHAEGETVRNEHKRGGRTKHRKHHFAGDGVQGMSSQPQAGSPVGDNSVRQEQKRGGRTKRSHHYWGQDVIGRLPLIGGIANSIANTVDTLDPDQYGGANYVADTPGRKAADIISTIGGLGTNLLMAKAGSKGGGGGAPAPKRKGGTVHHCKHRYHHAEGGAGKVRKGMMTESGHMIHQ